MRRAIVAISLCLVLAGCGTTDEKQSGLDVRQLSDGEKQALARSLSQKLSDPGGAQFKWMPVVGAPVAESKWIPTFSTSKGSPPLGYCALVSERGGGFRIFSATIAANSGGQYDHGAIDNVEGSAVSPGAPAATHGPVEDRCRGLGYSDFSLAQ
ncbi:hypothetical protein SAMN05519103_04443 [Rhizobiales bacterium GAS113]|nr:hypothetical protein SAMN05519103_04443 [Rhizobiales bacterium GAS113]